MQLSHEQQIQPLQVLRWDIFAQIEDSSDEHQYNLLQELVRDIERAQSASSTAASSSSHRIPNKKNTAWAKKDSDSDQD